MPAILNSLFASPVLSEQMTDTDPNASTECNFLTIAFLLDILMTPRASVTVVTIGSPSGMAATASDTVLVRSASVRMWLGIDDLTSDCEHLKP